MVTSEFHAKSELASSSSLLSPSSLSPTSPSNGTLLSADPHIQHHLTVHHNVNKTILSSRSFTSQLYSYQVYDWSFETQNSLKEAFFYGYIMTGVIGGRLAERFSVKHTVGTTVFISSLLSLTIPFIASYGPSAVFLARLLQGLANGMIDPGLNTIFSRYIPINERSLWGSIVYSGSSLGTMIMLIATGSLCQYHSLGGWKLAFYFHGVMGLIWYTIWQITIAERPQNHWFIRESELLEIQAGTQLDASKKSHPIPWKQIVTNLPFLAMVFASFVYNWAYLTMLTQLPSYFHRVLGLDVSKSDIISSLPYIAQSIMGYIGGMVLDRLRKNGRFSITFLRKTFNSIGFIGPAICLVINCFSGRNQTLAVTLITMNLGLCGFAISGFKITNVDLSPTFAGTLLGIANTIGNVPGILAPMLVSTLVHEGNSISEWNSVFLVAAGLFVIGTVVFVLFGSADLQPWDPGHFNYRPNNIKIKKIDPNGKETRIATIEMKFSGDLNAKIKQNNV
uniref:Major facilitator superfamily (MFS) profile domain-containing protein n=2 Tax=Tetranychus urticae TaxID=32264 RepID=T1KJA1_TETUR